MHLTEAPVDGGVAAGLQREVVDRALEGEAPAVDRGCDRGDRRLELAPARGRRRRHAGDCLGFPGRTGGDLTGSRSASPHTRVSSPPRTRDVARRGASVRCRARTTCSAGGIRDRRAAGGRRLLLRGSAGYRFARGRLASRVLPDEVEDDRQAGDRDDRGEGLGGVAQRVDREEGEHDGGRREGERGRSARSHPISARRRNAASPMRRKIIREHALPTEAIAERSTRFATTRTSAAVISRPACGPSREPRPKNGGNCPGRRASTSARPTRRAWR